MKRILLNLAMGFIVSTLGALSSFANDLEALAGKWLAEVKSPQGQNLKQSLEIKKDKFTFIIFREGGGTMIHAEGEVKVERLGPFKMARFFNIQGGSSATELEPMDDDRALIYTLENNELTAAMNFDKERDESPTVTKFTKQAATAGSGFRPLFNGRDTSGWQMRKADGHNSWTVEDGILKNTVKKDDHGTDLVTTQKFKDFTVKYEFLVPDNSNSGFYLRGRHEIQILGDFTSGKTALGGNGALYNFKAPDQFVSKPGDQWQTGEATMIGDRITVVLNGVKIHDNVECRKGTGGQLDNNVDQPGPIFLQGDHGTVWFRNMLIKEL